MHTLLYIYLIGVIATLIVTLIILASDDIQAIDVWTWLAYALLWPIKLLKAIYDVIYDMST